MLDWLNRAARDDKQWQGIIKTCDGDLTVTCRWLPVWLKLQLAGAPVHQLFFNILMGVRCTTGVWCVSEALKRVFTDWNATLVKHAFLGYWHMMSACLEMKL